MLHYDDLSADLEGEMRRLAGRLGIDVPEERWPGLLEAACFEHMRSRADVTAPETASAIWQDNRRFFHQGTSGQWRRLLDDEALERYWRRVRELSAPTSPPGPTTRRRSPPVRGPRSPRSAPDRADR